jgi:hypothetical protein
MRSRVQLSTVLALFFVLVTTSASWGCDEGGGAMTITGINPKAGHVGGDQTIEIQGKHFRTDIGYTVYFGNAKAKAVSIRNSESIVVTSPQNPEGTVDVTVRADDGNAFLLKQAFKYENMGGSVVEGLGESGDRKKKGNLQY